MAVEINPGNISTEQIRKLRIKINEIELNGEIKVKIHIISHKPLFQIKSTTKAIAEYIYFNNDYDKTEKKNTLFLLVINSLKEYCLLADEGLNQNFTTDYFNMIDDELRAAFSIGQYFEGINNMLEMLGNIPDEYSPVRTENLS